MWSSGGFSGKARAKEWESRVSCFTYLWAVLTRVIGYETTGEIFLEIYRGRVVVAALSDFKSVLALERLIVEMCMYVCVYVRSSTLKYVSTIGHSWLICKNCTLNFTIYNL